MNEAERIIKMFGGAYPLAEALTAALGRKVHPSTVYRWTYPAERNGTGGMVPSRIRRVLRRAARMHGIVWKEEGVL